MLPITVHQVELFGKLRHFVFSKRPLSAVILKAYLKFEKADPPIALETLLVYIHIHSS